MSLSLTTLDEFDIHRAISAYTNKEIGENNKQKHDMKEEEILIKHLTGKLNKESVKQIWQTEIRQTRKHQS